MTICMLKTSLFSFRWVYFQMNWEKNVCGCLCQSHIFHLVFLSVTGLRISLIFLPCYTKEHNAPFYFVLIKKITFIYIPLPLRFTFWGLLFFGKLDWIINIFNNVLSTMHILVWYSLISFVQVRMSNVLASITIKQITNWMLSYCIYT